jgi:hypothetical protein
MMEARSLARVLSAAATAQTSALDQVSSNKQYLRVMKREKQQEKGFRNLG